MESMYFFRSIDKNSNTKYSLFSCINTSSKLQWRKKTRVKFSTLGYITTNYIMHWHFNELQTINEIRCHIHNTLLFNTLIHVKCKLQGLIGKDSIYIPDNVSMLKFFQQRYFSDGGGWHSFFLTLQTNFLQRHCSTCLLVFAFVHHSIGTYTINLQFNFRSTDTRPIYNIISNNEVASEHLYYIHS